MKLDYAIDYPKHIRLAMDMIQHIRKYKYNSLYKKYFPLLDCLHGLHGTRKCFIVGTAPSLNKTNLSLLKNEHVFGVNTLYNAIDKIGRTPQYWGITDVDVFKQIGTNVLGLKTILFLTGQAGIYYLKNRDKYSHLREPVIIRNLGRMNYWNRFSPDLKKGVYGGRTVVIDSAIQPAYYLGFQEIYLLGCDCDYSKGHHYDGGEHVHVKEKEGGKPMSHPIDRKRVMDSYKVCKEFIEGNNRKIINCTVGGKLEVFDRMKLEDVINETNR